MDKHLEHMMFGSAMADAVMLDAAQIGVSGVEVKLTDFVNLYMNFRCGDEEEALKTRAILTGFLLSLSAYLVDGAVKGGENVH